jgi:hypothetical protein
MRAPPTRHVESAIGCLQGSHIDAARVQQGHPGAVRAQPGPAATAQGQHQRIGTGLHLPGGRGETHTRAGGVIGQPACPAVAHVKPDRHTCAPGLTQPVHPAAQQRRGLHVGREYTARCPDKGRDAQTLCPGAHLPSPETLQQRSDLPLACTEPGYEALGRLGVREVQAADTGQQELAPDRRHGVIDMHGHTCSRQHLCRHQAGRAPTNHCHGFHGEPISLDLPAGPGRRRRSGRRRIRAAPDGSSAPPAGKPATGPPGLAAAAAAGQT